MEKYAYIVCFAGVEYNDEIYYTGGDDFAVSDCAFEDKQEAVEYRKEKLATTMSQFHVGDFGYDENDEPAWMWCVNQGIDPSSGYDSNDYDTRMSYSQFIEMLENKGEDWTTYVPSLVDVRKVKIISAEVDPETLENARNNTVKIVKELN